MTKCPVQLAHPLLLLYTCCFSNSLFCFSIVFVLFKAVNLSVLIGQLGSSGGAYMQEDLSSNHVCKYQSTWEKHIQLLSSSFSYLWDFNHNWVQQLQSKLWKLIDGNVFMGHIQHTVKEKQKQIDKQKTNFSTEHRNRFWRIDQFGSFTWNSPQWTRVDVTTQQHMWTHQTKQATIMNWPPHAEYTSYTWLHR